MDLTQELATRMAGPQRYRLLQGYPMPAMMARCDPQVDSFASVKTNDRRPLILGILPHTSCAPSLPGCGFCTFPHETFQASRVRETAAAVAREIQMLRKRHPGICKRPVKAVYFGGGTANLTPADSLQEICRCLARDFRLQGAEVTLEGAPVFFLTKDGQLMEVLRRGLPTERLRISMGIQTFNPDQIKSMGREAFGDTGTISRVVDLARRRGFTTSGDFLLNLPGQSLEQMLQDASSAIEMGLDQICLYHLVLFRGLGTAWSKDKEKLGNLPSHQAAEHNWNEVRRFVLERGYVQTSLTNFERDSINQSPRRYIYEECSFQPAVYDALGFGPAALSTFSHLISDPADAEPPPGPRKVLYYFKQATRVAGVLSRLLRNAPALTSSGLKTMNEPLAQDYVARIGQGSSPLSRVFNYLEMDMKLLYLTRGLSSVTARLEHYMEAYGSHPGGDFYPEMTVLQGQGLVELDTNTLRLTPRGMYYADAVAGLLASSRIRQRRAGPVSEADDPNSSAFHSMG